MLTAADLLDDQLIPFLDEHGLYTDHVGMDRGAEFFDTHDRREYEFYLVF